MVGMIQVGTAVLRCLKVCLVREVANEVIEKGPFRLVSRLGPFGLASRLGSASLTMDEEGVTEEAVEES